MYAGVGGGGRHTDSNNPMHAYLLINGLWRVWMANVPLDRLRIDQVTEKSLGKDVRKQTVEE